MKICNIVTDLNNSVIHNFLQFFFDSFEDVAEKTNLSKFKLVFLSVISIIT